MTADAPALLQESRERASRGDVAGAISLACEALDRVEQGSALETEVADWLEELQRKDAAPRPPPEPAELPDGASARDSQVADVTSTGDDEAGDAPAIEDRHDASDRGTLVAGGEADATETPDTADIPPAAESSGIDAARKDGMESSSGASKAKAPPETEDAELLAAVRAYRRDLEVGTSEPVAPSSVGGPRTHSIRGGTRSEHDFEDGEQREEADEGSLAERLLKSSFTMLGAAVLMLVVVAVAVWLLFFSETETRPKTRTASTAQTGWPDLTYKERRRGLVSPEEASSALKRAYAATRREMNEPDEERLQPGGLTKDEVEAVSELSQVHQGKPGIEQGIGVGASASSAPPQLAGQQIAGSGEAGTSASQRGATRGRRGGKTGRKPASGTTVAKRPPVDEGVRPRRGRWFFGTGATETDTEKPKAPATERLKRAPIPIGDPIKARLEMGVSSLSHGQVMARLVESVTVGKFTLPKGALLLGTSSNRGARVFLDFERVIHGGEPWSLVGEAVAEDKMKGLPARKRTVSLEERQQAAVARGALGALRKGVVARTGTVGQLVDEAAGGAVEEVREDQQVDESVVYEVAAGEEFTLVVTR
jgi:hypothetical protein